MELNESDIKVIVPISGGKDSQACIKLAVAKFGANHVQGLFCDTRYEHSLTYQHVDKIAELYGVKINKVCAGSVKEKIIKYKRFPAGGARFCTDELKIIPSKKFYKALADKIGGFEVWYGMRSDESSDRKKRYAGIINSDLYLPNEVMKKYPKYLGKLGVKFRLPVLDWSTADVFEYLAGEGNALYDLGFERVGCFPCLAAGDHHKEKCFTFDEEGEKNLATARSLESITGHSVYTSKSGQFKHDSGQTDLFQGCAICAI